MGVRVRPITFDPSPYLAAAELEARAGETMGRGYAALGSGIASGINTAVERHDRKTEIARQESHFQAELGMQKERLGMERERLGMEHARVEDANDIVASELLEKAIEGYDAQAKQMVESAEDPQQVLADPRFRALQTSKASAMSSRLAIAAKRTKRAGVMPPTEVTVVGGDEPAEAAPRQSHLYKLTDKNTVAGLLEEAKLQLEQASRGTFSVGKEVKRRLAEKNVRTYTTYLGMAEDKEKRETEVRKHEESTANQRLVAEESELAAANAMRRMRGEDPFAGKAEYKAYLDERKQTNVEGTKQAGRVSLENQRAENADARQKRHETFMARLDDVTTNTKNRKEQMAELGAMAQQAKGRVDAMTDLLHEMERALEKGSSNVSEEDIAGQKQVVWQAAEEHKAALLRFGQETLAPRSTAGATAGSWTEEEVKAEAFKEAKGQSDNEKRKTFARWKAMIGKPK